MSGIDSTGGDVQPVAVPAADALRELADLADLDVEQHPAVYQRIHTELQGALASIDDA
jgi:hypothetical protein